MPRRKEKKIALLDLECSSAVITELKSKSELIDFDPATAVLIIKGERRQYFIRDIDKAIKNLERYLSANKYLINEYEGQQIIHRKQLARMLGVSRPTLNKWIENGFITPVPLKYIPGDTFPVLQTLEQLKSYESKRN